MTRLILVMAVLAIAALAVIGWFLHKFSLSAIPDPQPLEQRVAWIQAHRG